MNASSPSNFSAFIIQDSHFSDEPEKLDVRKFEAGEPIDVGAFAEPELGAETAAYFIGPRAGGTEVLHGKREVLVITPQSPLGE
jgi:hypothetical protein